MKAYITISHGGSLLGTLRLTLRPDIVPRTVDNFVHFLTTKTESSSSSSSSPTPGYCNSTFHRIIPKFMAQGGDFINHNGTGSTSIFGPSFVDENFLLSHSQRGTLSMANSGANTNGCQFFLTFKPTAHLDGVHVVFGYVDWRDDEESAAVLDKLERVKTDRRNDRPLEEVKIVECGIIDDDRKSSMKASDTSGGNKLVGEAKKNKLLQAYGEVNQSVVTEAAVDDDEIDLDDDDEKETESGGGNQLDNSSSKVANDADDEDENDHEPAADDGDKYLGDDSELVSPAIGGKLSKKAALQKRLAALRTKINQSRTLNRREVHAEATRLGTEEASMQERKRQNKQDRITKQKEYDTFVVGKLRVAGGEVLAVEGKGGNEQKKLASLTQPAYDSIWEMNKLADRQERSQHGPNDYYNPEGQYANYERNLKSVRHGAFRKGDATTLDSYDPTVKNHPNTNNNSNKQSIIYERDGARQLANEMKRRAEKKANQKRKLEFDAVDVTSINERNKKFNQKIGRNFDKHTAEIRQNLERGTAL